jgi:peptidoglycan hydrolase CwlO-like protein
MKPLFIILAQSNTGAVILILVLLLVSGIIGYLTAWYYARSVYTPVIKGLEADKTDLKKNVSGLEEDVSKLRGKVEKLNDKINKLEEEIAEKDKKVKSIKKAKK